MLGGKRFLGNSKHNAIGSIGMLKQLGPVVFQNIGRNKGNTVTTVRYINKVLILCAHSAQY